MPKFDLAIIETLNGGDLQLIGNDLAVVNSIENMFYLAMFGGNQEAVTQNRIVETQAFDWYGNSLFFQNSPSVQFNSYTEKTINNTPLTSQGRVIIENAIKKDFEFLKAEGITAEVTVEIVATDEIRTRIVTTLPDERKILTIVTFKKSSSGDFSLLDFNSDFLL